MKKILFIAILGFAICANAQVGFDYFGPARQITLVTPKILSGAAVGLNTNNWVDVRVLTGIARIDVFSCTNANSGTMSATIEQSSDTTNWVALSNYALATAANVLHTNYYYGGTSPVATNRYNLPGSATTPTAATAGFATAYLNPVQFTNSGALTIDSAGVYSVGFNADECRRYLRVIFAPAGAATNCSVGATIVGRPKDTHPWTN